VGEGVGRPEERATGGGSWAGGGVLVAARITGHLL